MKELGKEMNDNFCALEELRKWDERHGCFEYGTMVITVLACGLLASMVFATIAFYWNVAGSAY